MGTNQTDAATRRNRKAGEPAQGQADDAEWNTLDSPKRCPVTGAAGGLRSLTVSVCPLCQMAG